MTTTDVIIYTIVTLQNCDVLHIHTKKHHYELLFQYKNTLTVIKSLLNYNNHQKIIKTQIKFFKNTFLSLMRR